jgi:glycosyltransferase involved in cell wall biosynthesis
MSTLNSIERIPNHFRSDCEHIIIDGVSKDQTIQYCENYIQSAPISTFFLSEGDTGIYDAMNKGIQNARGEFCVFINCGDLLDSNVDFDKVFDSLFSNLTLNNSAGIAFNVTKIGGGMMYRVKSRQISIWRLRMPSVHQGIVYKTDFLLRNKYDTSLKICSDFKSIIIAMERSMSFQVVNIDFAILSLGGISTEKPIQLLKESIGLILKSRINYLAKITSSLSIFLSVLGFFGYYKFLKLLSKSK